LALEEVATEAEVAFEMADAGIAQRSHLQKSSTVIQRPS